MDYNSRMRRPLQRMALWEYRAEIARPTELPHGESGQGNALHIRLCELHSTVESFEQKAGLPRF